MKSLLILCYAIQNDVFSAVLLTMGLLFLWIGTNSRADNYLSNLDCAVPHAMTYPDVAGDVMLFVIYPLTVVYSMSSMISNSHEFD